MDINRKFGLTLAAFAVLGVLAWTTLSDEPIRVFDVSISLRAATLCVLGLFAVRAGLYFLRARLEKSAEGRQSAAAEEVAKPM